ncbi:hypothetical protein MKW98_031059 [Papaver atlanticum]|uniref:Uncharacterized protein n=1 Tax=Papaver atlanticum TaxID=357466 RepID=A0AAD4SW14_9MAGN|nr:hypothetical protein MKW98_031059 [Papaver atlanticum]
MVQGMKDVITDIVGELARCQQDAARFWKDAYRYYCELEELKFRMGGNVAVSQDLMAPVSPVKKRKMIPGESVPWDTKAVQIYIPEPLPPSVRSSGGRSNAMPASAFFPVQVPDTKDNENAVRITSMRCSQEKFVNEETLLYCSELQTETVESLEFVEPVRESVEAIMTSSSTMYQTEGFEFVENLEIPAEYENLYKNISNKYGHMATRNVIKCNDAILLTLVVRLLKNISEIETMPVAELSELFLDRWEGDIKVAETLQFNIKWLRQKFNKVKKCWRLDKDTERHEQELDSSQLKYVGLWARKQELDKEIAEVKAQIRNAEAKISSEREAIREKLAQIYDQIQPVQALQGTVLS